MSWTKSADVILRTEWVHAYFCKGHQTIVRPSVWPRTNLNAVWAIGSLSALGALIEAASLSGWPKIFIFNCWEGWEKCPKSKWASACPGGILYYPMCNQKADRMLMRDCDITICQTLVHTFLKHRVELISACVDVIPHLYVIKSLNTSINYS